MQKNKKALPILAIITLALLAYPEAAINLAFANPHYQPPVDPGYYYIKSDGSITPETAPIQRQGNVYTLTGNITGHPIWILYSGAVLDGAGFTLKSNKTGYESGVTLNCTRNVIVKNLDVEEFRCGITIKRLYYGTPYDWDKPYPPENPYPKSNSNSIINCKIENNRCGILTQSSTKNQIINNTIKSNNVGIQMEGGEETICANIITNNLLENNYEGILLDQCSSNTITSNTIAKSGLCGLGIARSSGNTIQYNLVTTNDLGILVNGAPGDDTTAKQNTITKNQIIQNNQWGIRLNGSQTDNRIYANNFVDNNLGKGLQVSIPMYMDSGVANGQTYVHMLSGLANVWNTESAGNYWSDFQKRYPNTTENGDFWDTPFTINENNIDQRPLIGPLTLEAPMLEHEQENADSPTLPYNAIAVIAAACIIAACVLLVYRRRSKKVT